MSHQFPLVQEIDAVVSRNGVNPCVEGVNGIVPFQILKHFQHDFLQQVFRFVRDDVSDEEEQPLVICMPDIVEQLLPACRIRSGLNIDGP